MTTWLWIIGSLYVAFLVGATVRSWHRSRNTDDYMFAGSNVGVALGFLTTAATLFSTFTLMGMPDFFRTHGVGAWIFLGIPDGAVVFVMIWFGFHLRRRVAEKGFAGVAGLMRDCYGNRWGGYLYFVGIFLFLVPYVAIQIRGISIFLGAAFTDALPFWGWSTIIVVSLLIYSEIGGLRAIILSDALQGVLLLSATWIIAVVCIQSFGGVAEMFEQVRRTEPALLSVPGPQGLFSTQFLIASFFAILMVPVTQPQVTVRLVIMRDTHAMQRMAIPFGVFAVLILLAVIPIGMYGSVHYADLPTSEFLANVLLFDQAPLVAAIVSIGLIAAAMSTADSQIFALGTELRSLLSGTERAVMLRTKLAILFFALAALVFSIFSGDQLVLLARVGFAGTSLLGPLVLAAVLAERPPGFEIVVATAAGLFLFLASLAGLIPDTVGPVRLDLLLFVALSLFAFFRTAYKS